VLVSFRSIFDFFSVSCFVTDYNLIPFAFFICGTFGVSSCSCVWRCASAMPRCCELWALGFGL